MSAGHVLTMLNEREVESIDSCFTDTKGEEQYVTIPAHQVNTEFFERGKIPDGSSIGGWKDVNESDAVLMPNASTIAIDPSFTGSTLIIRCGILGPGTLQDYGHDPRSTTKHAEDYLCSTDIADTVLFGPKPEFLLFNDARFGSSTSGSHVVIDDIEGTWDSSVQYEGGNKGRHPAVESGYFPTPPVDPAQDVRSEMCLMIEQMDLVVRVHHHEVATADQNEMATRFNTTTKKTDEVQIYKYAVHNVVHRFGKTAASIPKPIFGDNGSNMHCYMSLSENGVSLFTGDEYAGLSEQALYHIDGIIKHAKVTNVLAGPTTNSYERLVPGYETLVILAYSTYNRSASIRIPVISSLRTRCVEVRFPDSAANPYLCFAALLMAGPDDIKNRIHLGGVMGKDLYNLPPEKAKEILQVAGSLEGTLNELGLGRGFLKVSDAFTDEATDAYVALRRKGDGRMHTTPHPVEFELYYSTQVFQLSWKLFVCL